MPTMTQVTDQHCDYSLRLIAFVIIVPILGVVLVFAIPIHILFAIMA